MSNFFMDQLREKSPVRTADGLTFTEIGKQERRNGSFIVDAGIVEGENKPADQTCYLQIEREDEPTSIMLFRPDDLQSVVSAASLAVWAALMNDPQEFAKTFGKRMSDFDLASMRRYAEHDKSKWIDENPGVQVPPDKGMWVLKLLNEIDELKKELSAFRLQSGLGNDEATAVNVHQ